MIRCPKSLLKILKVCMHRLSNVSSVVSGSESLSRYIIDKNYYRSSDKTVKHNAFMPAKNGTTSIYRIGDLAEGKIWRIGVQYVAKKRGKPLLGRADILASKITKYGLKIEPDICPHPRHANIIDWPDEEGSKRRSIAQELAAAAQLRLYQPSDVST